MIEYKKAHCPICKDRFMNIHGQPLPNHAQVACKTSRGDDIEIGLCKNCIVQGVSVDTLNEILDGYKAYWEWEVDTNKILKKNEKKKRKEFHNSHVISTVERVRHTGKEAHTKAREMGKLL
jgi:hypothetical protein